MPSGSASSAAPSTPATPSTPPGPRRLAPRPVSRSTSRSTSPTSGVTSRRCRFRPVFGGTGGPPQAELRPATGGLDRGLPVPVPHQGPAQHPAPEHPDPTGAVAGDLGEEPAPGQEGASPARRRGTRCPRGRRGRRAPPRAVGRRRGAGPRAAARSRRCAPGPQRRRWSGAGASGSGTATGSRSPRTGARPPPPARQERARGLLDDVPTEQAGQEASLPSGRGRRGPPRRDGTPRAVTGTPALSPRARAPARGRRRTARSAGAGRSRATSRPRRGWRTPTRCWCRSRPLPDHAGHRSWPAGAR